MDSKDKARAPHAQDQHLEEKRPPGPRDGKALRLMLPSPHESSNLPHLQLRANTLEGTSLFTVNVGLLVPSNVSEFQNILNSG